MAREPSPRKSGASSEGFWIRCGIFAQRLVRLFDPPCGNPLNTRQLCRRPKVDCPKGTATFEMGKCDAQTAGVSHDVDQLETSGTARDLLVRIRRTACRSLMYCREGYSKIRVGLARQLISAADKYARAELQRRRGAKNFIERDRIARSKLIRSDCYCDSR